MAKLYRYETTDGNAVTCREVDGFTKTNDGYFHQEYGFTIAAGKIFRCTVERAAETPVYVAWMKPASTIEDAKNVLTNVFRPYKNNQACRNFCIRFDGKTALCRPIEDRFGAMEEAMRQDAVMDIMIQGMADTGEEAEALYETAMMCHSVIKNGFVLTVDYNEITLTDEYTRIIIKHDMTNAKRAACVWFENTEELKLLNIDKETAIRKNYGNGCARIVGEA